MVYPKLKLDGRGQVDFKVYASSLRLAVTVAVRYDAERGIIAVLSRCRYPSIVMWDCIDALSKGNRDDRKIHVPGG
jgi:hypothetical protein